MDPKLMNWMKETFPPGPLPEKLIISVPGVYLLTQGSHFQTLSLKEGDEVDITTIPFTVQRLAENDGHKTDS